MSEHSSFEIRAKMHRQFSGGMVVAHAFEAPIAKINLEADAKDLAMICVNGKWFLPAPESHTETFDGMWERAVT